jgi:hypothetical protein
MAIKVFMEVVEGDRPQELFIVVDDVRVAERGDPNTPQALSATRWRR